MTQLLVETRGLRKYFNTSRGKLHAVDGVDFSIEEGKTLGIVGESGCGKSTLGRVILRLTDATEGEVLYQGKDILTYGRKKMLDMRKKMQMIFQDPYASLNPRMTVSEIIAEPIRIMKTLEDKQQINRRVYQMMNVVGLSGRLVNAYPHELDGGRRQRIGVARALAVDPAFIVCDEPVSALDVSIQAQILNMLMDLQEEFGLTYMFITHDLSVVKHISDDIGVMYLGQCVELSSSRQLFERPLHPYTQALLDAIPMPDPDHAMGEILKGEVTSPIEPSPGCRFANRCKHAHEACLGQDIPVYQPFPGHQVKCVLYQEGAE
ncbi:MAG: ATP-binding cassette domain-containing protein [Clostridiaceae bacterium]|jgi:peptide/nickel transport system ATP-binding protein|nr:ATP-binding cassette domain-containing protein [Clostridiaceae bacterium]